MTPQEIIDQQDADLEQESRALKKRTSTIVHKAEIALIIWLFGQLLLKDGYVVQSAANLTVISLIPDKFDEFLREYGVDAALKQAMSHFDQQVGLFQQVVKSLGGEYVPFTGEDALYFQARKKAAAAALINQVAPFAESFEDRARAALGNRVTDLHEAVAEVMGKLPARLSSTFSTEIFVFSRSVADRGYAIIQAQDKTSPMKYHYAGPGSGDPVIRPFCKERMSETEHGVTWVRDEIDRMTNREHTPVFTTCGGSNCRHTWLAVLNER